VRVVSLVPSVTETLLAWGVDVVACTRFCEQPTMRHVGGTKDPDIAAIVALAPDVVVVDREENRRDDADALTAAGLRVHVTHVVDVEGVPTMLAELAAAVSSRGDLPEIAAVSEASATVPHWATAATLIWRRPWMAIGDATYGSSVLRRLGIGNVMAGADSTYPEVTLAQLAELSPTFVLLPSEPYPFAERHVAGVAAGVPGAEVVLLDGRDLFWWGCRTPEALQRLSAALRGRLPTT
jgi:ABC-type hemin transport system substrate-binding protein